MDKPTRLTPNKTQERISLHQFRERLEQFGWVATRPDEDLGEDFIVHIYFEGQATGVTFHAQIKSITNLDRRRKGDYLIYDDIKVKDLKHWQEFSLPVVLFIWDVDRREGRWALVADVIEDLDKRRPNWRENKSKTRVYLPWENTTDDVGLKRLTRRIAHHLYPLLSIKNPIKSIEISHKFPDTSEGNADLTNLINAIEKGFPAKVGFVSEISYSPSPWNHWLGDVDLENVTITIASSIPNSISGYMSAISQDGNEVFLPTTEFKQIENKSNLVKFSNQHQCLPIRFDLRIDFSVEGSEPKISLTYKLEHTGRTAKETQETRDFLEAITNGQKINLWPVKGKESLPTRMVSFDYTSSLNVKFLSYIDKISAIQNKIGQLILLPEEITETDLYHVNELFAVTHYGKCKFRHSRLKTIGTFKVEALKLFLDAQPKSKRHRLTLNSPDSYVELFNQKIQTGRMTRHVSGKLDITNTELKNAIESLDPDQGFPIDILDGEIIEVFPDWFIREAERLSKLLVENFDVEAVYLFGSLAWGGRSACIRACFSSLRL
ncbi:MAG: DUF4365 domain-containing protein [Anaerolineae bacterium]|nr:DUF4365 domain-containing protein [Anaerolineae bacterium]